MPVIEPFDPDKHDRSGFSCGVAQVDNYFRKTANKLAKADNVRLYVMVSDEGEVIGFYSLNAHAVAYEDLPKKYARTRPAHGSIPAAYISMIGRDRRFHGGGYGGDLLADALKRILRAADAVGIAVVMLDVLDCGDTARVARRKALYEGYGFRALKSDPLRMFLPVGVVRLTQIVGFLPSNRDIDKLKTGLQSREKYLMTFLGVSRDLVIPASTLPKTLSDIS